MALRESYLSTTKWDRQILDLHDVLRRCRRSDLESVRPPNGHRHGDIFRRREVRQPASTPAERSQDQCRSAISAWP